MLIWGKLVTQQETCLNVSLSREESAGSAEWIPEDQTQRLISGA